MEPEKLFRVCEQFEELYALINEVQKKVDVLRSDLGGELGVTEMGFALIKLTETSHWLTSANAYHNAVITRQGGLTTMDVLIQQFEKRKKPKK